MEIYKRGIAKKALIIRHLVLPNKAAGSFEILKFIAEKLSKNSYVNIMDQYRPCYRAGEYSELRRRTTYEEYKEVLDYAASLGLRV